MMRRARCGACKRGTASELWSSRSVTLMYHAWLDAVKAVFPTMGFVSSLLCAWPVGMSAPVLCLSAALYGLTSKK